MELQASGGSSKLDDSPNSGICDGPGLFTLPVGA